MLKHEDKNKTRNEKTVVPEDCQSLNPDCGLTSRKSWPWNSMFKRVSLVILESSEENFYNTYVHILNYTIILYCICIIYITMGRYTMVYSVHN